ncbi:MAG: redoxin domain-containing protein [Bacteroidia bacterium]
MRGGLIGALLWAGLYAQPEKYPPAQEFPKFLLYTLDGKPFTDKDLPPAQRGRIVFFFDPYCDHCQKQATFLRENAAALKDFQLIWVSTETAESIRKFQDTYLKGLPNIFVLRDKDFKFDGFFGYSVAPTIYVYDRAGKLRSVYREEVPVSRLLQGL